MIRSFFRRFASLLERRRRARRLGIHYRRDRDWQMPRVLEVDHREQPLSLPDDQGTSIAFKDIFVSDVYGLEKIKVPPATIIDVGGHAGLFSLAARCYFPQAIIHTYEPNALVWKHLEANAKVGGFHPFPHAVGRLRQRVHLEFGADSVFTRCVANESGGTVEMISLGEAIEHIAPQRQLDLLKLDCEGAEWEILQDRAALLRVNQITMEYHLSGSKTIDALLDLLRELNFRVEFVHADGPTYGRIWAVRA